MTNHFCGFRNHLFCLFKASVVGMIVIAQPMALHATTVPGADAAVGASVPAGPAPAPAQEAPAQYLPLPGEDIQELSPAGRFLAAAMAEYLAASNACYGDLSMYSEDQLNAIQARLLAASLDLEHARTIFRIQRMPLCQAR